MGVEQETMPQLDVPYISQKDEETSTRYGRRGCGLTSLRMVLAYYGADLGLDQMDELIQEAGAYTEDRGWIHSGLVDIARGEGLSGYRIDYSQLADGDLSKAKEVFTREGTSPEELAQFEESFNYAREHGPIADLTRLIDKGVPVITSMERSYANTLATHMIVLIWHDDDQFVVQDPWDFGPKHKVSFEDFQRGWTNRAIIITSPNPSPLST